MKVYRERLIFSVSIYTFDYLVFDVYNHIHHDCGARLEVIRYPNEVGEAMTRTFCTSEMEYIPSCVNVLMGRQTTGPPDGE